MLYREKTQAWVPTTETFTREEIAEQLGIGRTTLWRIERQIVEPARILDFYRYTKSHPRRLDWYCVFVLTRGFEHLKGEKSYEAALEKMRQQRQMYSRQSFDQFVEQKFGVKAS